MKTRDRRSGFSLIELLVAVSIVGILAAIAYPGYVGQIQKTRRADAKVGLTQMAHQLERCFTEFNVYNNVNCAIVGGAQTINTTSADGHYTITSNRGGERLTASQFMLFAIPVNNDPQASDVCGIFTLDNFGNKTPATIGCWE